MHNVCNCFVILQPKPNIMKRKLTILFLLFIAAAVPTIAQDYHLRHDTVYVYQSWEAIFDQYPDTMLVNPSIEAYNQFDIHISTSDQQVNEMLEDDAVAVAIGDTLWLVSASWMQRNFKGDCNKMNAWVPLYFNEKIAFVQWQQYRSEVGMQLLGALLGDPELFDKDPEEMNGELYLIDFDLQRVYKLNHKVLSRLLDPYPDLLRRYVSMKDYKKQYMVESYFLEYIDRITADPTVPRIID